MKLLINIVLTLLGLPLLLIFLIVSKSYAQSKLLDNILGGN